MSLILYIDSTKPAVQNPVASTTYTSTDASSLFFVGGDKFPLEFKFDDVNLMTASLSYYLAIGDLGSTTPLYTTTQFAISSSYSVSCSLDLTSVTSSTTSQISPYMQFAVHTPSGSSNRKTYMLRKITVYNPVDI